MSQITKLSIQGIRSFDPEHRETISFGVPLTLIVGQNGSGKTTIIECLKYATTGDLPPNSKGGAFVHDPKITGDKDVKAQVKLAFKNINGVQMICSRSMQLTLKKTTQTFKTLEGQLLAMNHGERTTVSSRIAELDSQMPLYLGVSKAVLDYVIFCHQEDSLWPLAEPSVLKKRFDEIFEALKFTKALENIKVIRKELGTDIKLLTQSVDHCKVEKDRAKKTSEKREELQKEVGRYQNEISNLQEELDNLTERSDQLFERHREFRETLNQFDGLTHRKQLVQDQIDKLSLSVKLLNETPESLEEKLANSTAELELLKSSVRTDNDNITDLTQQIKNLRLACNGEISTVESVRAKLNSLHALRNKQLDAIQDKSELFSLGIPKSSILESRNEETIRKSLVNRFKAEILAKIDKKNSSMREELDALIKDLSEKRSALQELHNEKSAKAQKREVFLDQVGVIDQELKSLREEIDKLNSDENDLVLMETEVTELREKLKNFEAQYNNPELDRSISDVTREIKQLEAEAEEIGTEFSKSSRETEARAKLDYISGELSLKEKNVASLIQKNSDTFKSVTSKELDSRNCSEILKNLKLSAEKHKAELEQSLQIAKEDLNTITHQHKTTQSKLQQLKEESDSIEIEKVAPLLDSETEFETRLDEAEENLRVATQNKENASFTEAYFTFSIDCAEKKQKCLLCNRKFATATDVDKFINEIRAKIEHSQVSPDELEHEWAEIRAERDSLADLKPHILRLRELNSSLIPTAEKELENAAKKLDFAAAYVQQYVKQVADATSKFQAIDNLEKPVQTIVGLQAEIDSFRVQLEALGPFQMLDENGKQVRSLSELQTALSEKNSEIKTKRNRLYELNQEKDSLQRRIHSTTANLKDKELKLNNLQHSVSKHATTLERLKSQEEEQTRLKEVVINLAEELENISLKIEQLEVEVEESQQDIDLLESEKNGEIQVMRSVLSEVESMDSDIERMNEESLLEIERQHRGKITEFEKSIEDKEELVEGLRQKVSQTEQEIADFTGTERNIRDNLDLMKFRFDLGQIEQQIFQLDIDNAETEKVKYEQESAELKQKYSDLTKTLAGKQGEIRQMEDQIKSLDDELRTEYAGADEAYQREYLKLTTKTKAVDDLVKYGRALDNAIMQFHSLKMKEINDIIDELWKKTYSGTDVDTILIRSDAHTSNTGSAVGNRSYNYRVCMVKQDVELDMRGRCSAGQKVLACIIIRLALAECFGINCGMIALDEPTTNLDAENIESLARSLGAIIELRQAQKNFQLIVITHDEHFLAYMDASAYTDHFFRVSRNERQKSEIEMVEISKVVA